MSPIRFYKQKEKEGEAPSESGQIGVIFVFSVALLPKTGRFADDRALLIRVIRVIRGYFLFGAMETTIFSSRGSPATVLIVRRSINRN
jgi:hypothetical protein